MSNSTESTEHRAVLKFDNDDVQYLIPFAQQGRLGCTVSIRRNSNTFVDEIYLNRKLLSLDASSSTGSSSDDDDSSVEDTTRMANDEQFAETRQRRHEFCRAVKRMFAIVVSHVESFTTGWRDSRGKNEVKTTEREQLPQQYYLTPMDRWEDLISLFSKIRRDLYCYAAQLRKTSEKEGGNGKKTKCRVPKHYPDHRRSPSFEMESIRIYS